MNRDFAFTIRKTRFDENYLPSDDTRLTTNFANLARGDSRKENLRNALQMIDSRFNALANWDNSDGKRYSVVLDIISVDIDVAGDGQTFPTLEMLKTNIVDHKAGETIEGVVGNNFSSYVRDYDFSVLLLDHNKDKTDFTIPNEFGDLHGKIFKHFIDSKSYKNNFDKPPVICLSVSENKIYIQSDNYHPVLGNEYFPNESSLTEEYFKKMGLQVRYFMPPNSVAPLAFYFFGDLLNDYTNLELISTTSTMETFQKIYRPEIYNANAAAGEVPRLKNEDYSLTQVVYDREERSRLAVEQGKWCEENFIQHYQPILEKWAEESAA